MAIVTVKDIYEEAEDEIRGIVYEAGFPEDDFWIDYFGGLGGTVAFKLEYTDEIYADEVVLVLKQAGYTVELEE